MRVGFAGRVAHAFLDSKLTPLLIAASDSVSPDSADGSCSAPQSRCPKRCSRDPGCFASRMTSAPAGRLAISSR